MSLVREPPPLQGGPLTLSTPSRCGVRGGMCVAYKVFKLEADKNMLIAKVTGDDLVGRQSIVVRESHALGMEPGWKFLLVEGNEDGVARAVELMKENGVTPYDGGDEVYKKIKAEEEEAAGGMGMIFG